jgi:hypothetical protein
MNGSCPSARALWPNLRTRAPTALPAGTAPRRAAGNMARTLRGCGRRKQPEGCGRCSRGGQLVLALRPCSRAVRCNTASGGLARAPGKVREALKIRVGQARGGEAQPRLPAGLSLRLAHAAHAQRAHRCRSRLHPAQHLSGARLPPSARPPLSACHMPRPAWRLCRARSPAHVAYWSAFTHRQHITY